MKVALLTIGDGRDETHERSWESLQAAFRHTDTERVIVDDRSHELGFGGAIREGWSRIPRDADYVFHAELDFLYDEQIDVEGMAAVLEAHPNLAQLVLKRGPANREEAQAGGIVEQWPDEYRQRTWRGYVWTEHRLFWSTNPSLYPAAWSRQRWPECDGSERAWTDRLVADADLRFAFWGASLDAPTVTHIGVREGTGY